MKSNFIKVAVTFTQTKTTSYINRQEIIFTSQETKFALGRCTVLY